MVLTPTYHVFNMFTTHHYADLLEVEYDTGAYIMDGIELPHVSASASKKEGQVFLTLVNLSHQDSSERLIDLEGDYEYAQGRILTNGTLDMQNTFTHPGRLTPKAFSNIKKRMKDMQYYCLLLRF